MKKNMIVIIAVIVIVFVSVFLIFLKSKDKNVTVDEQTVSGPSAVSSDSVSADTTSEMTAEEFNDLSPEERLAMFSDEELEELEEYGIYENPADAQPEWIPGTVPTRDQALSLLYEPAAHAFEVMGVYRNMPVILSDPWASNADEGGFSCYINNEYGTSVLYGHVNKDGETSVWPYGSQYNEGFVGIMYADKPENNPPEEMIIKLEKAMIEKPKSLLAMQIEGYDGKTVYMTDSAGNHFSYDID